MMKILLISDNVEVQDGVRAELATKDANLEILSDRTSIQRFIESERPEVIINAILGEKAEQISNIKLPLRYTENQGYWSYDLDDRSMLTAAKESILYFIKTIPIPDKEEPYVRFAVRNSRMSVKTTVKRASARSRKAAAARKAVAEAKEALSGLVSNEEDPSLYGNRLPVPLSREVFTTLHEALDASKGLATTALPVREIAAPMRRVIAFLQDAEKVIKQLEKTAAAGIKAAGVLGILAAAIAGVVWKLKDFIGAI